MSKNDNKDNFLFLKNNYSESVNNNFNFNIQEISPTSKRTLSNKRKNIHSIKNQWLIKLS